MATLIPTDILGVSYVPRSAAQLAAAPTSTDQAFGPSACFYDTAAPQVLWRMNAAMTAFQPVVAGAGKLAYTLIPIGDSIVFTSGCCGTYEYGSALAGARYTVLRNAGVNGNTTAMMLSRFAADVVAYAPDYAAIQGSVNNIGAGIAVTTMLSHYTDMIAQARAASIVPIIVAMPPYDTAPYTITSYNRALWRLAQTLRVQFIDPWADSVNAADGKFRSGYSSDGTHPTQTSLRLAAVRFNAALTLPTYQPVLPWGNTDTANRISNGLFITNTVAGKPDGWTIDAAFTSSLSSATLPALGNFWKLDFSALATYKVCTISPSFSGLAAGDVCALVARVRCTGFEANGNGPSPGQGKVDASLVLSFSGPGGGVYLAGGTSIGGDIDGVFSNVFTLPAGTVGLSMTLAVGPRTGNITGSIELAQLGLFKIS